MEKNIYVMTALYTVIALIVFVAVRYFLGLGISALELVIVAVIIAAGFYLVQRYLPCEDPKKKNPKPIK